MGSLRRLPGNRDQLQVGRPTLQVGRVTLQRTQRRHLLGIQLTPQGHLRVQRAQLTQLGAQRALSNRTLSHARPPKGGKTRSSTPGTTPTPQHRDDHAALIKPPRRSRPKQLLNSYPARTTNPPTRPVLGSTTAPPGHQPRSERPCSCVATSLLPTRTAALRLLPNCQPGWGSVRTGGISHQVLIRDFYDHLGDGAPFWINPREAIKSLRIIKDVYAQSFVGS